MSQEKIMETFETCLDESLEKAIEFLHLTIRSENKYESINTQTFKKLNSRIEKIIKEGKTNTDLLECSIYFNVKTGNHSQARALLEQIPQSEKNPNLLFSTFNLSYQKVLNHDQAISNINQMADCFNKTRDISNDPTKDFEEVSRALYHLSEMCKEMYWRFPGTASVELSEQINKNPEEHLKKMIDILRDNDQFKSNTKKIDESVSTIRIPQDHQLRGSIIVKESKKTYDSEIKNSEILKKILDPKINLPQALAHFKEGDKFYYVMKHEEGKTLTELIKQDEIDEHEYEKILENLSKIHVHFPTKGLHPYDFSEQTIIKGEANNYSSRFIKAMQETVKYLENSPLWCYNNDSATNNWVINSESITLVDTEDRGSIPFSTDLAQFLTCLPKFFKIQDQIKFVNTYIKNTNNEFEKIGSKKRIHENFILEYLNSVIYRSFANSCNKNNENKDVVLAIGVIASDFLKEGRLRNQHDKIEYPTEPYSIINYELTDKLRSSTHL